MGHTRRRQKPKTGLGGCASGSSKRAYRSCARPLGVAVDKTGALLIADDVGNTVWRVTSADQHVMSAGQGGAARCLSKGGARSGRNRRPSSVGLCHSCAGAHVEFNPITLAECGEDVDTLAANLTGHILYYVDDLRAQMLPFGEMHSRGLRNQHAIAGL